MRTRTAPRSAAHPQTILQSSLLVVDDRTLLGELGLSSFRAAGVFLEDLVAAVYAPIDGDQARESARGLVGKMEVALAEIRHLGCQNVTIDGVRRHVEALEAAIASMEAEAGAE